MPPLEQTLTEEKPETEVADAVADKSAETKPEADAGKQAEAAADKPVKGGSILDDDDEDDGKGDDKAKDKQEADKDASDKGKEDDKAETPEQKAEQWRDRLADKLLAKAKDTLSVSKFEKRRDVVLKQLQRFKSIEEAALSGFSAMEKLRSGDHKKLPENEADQAAWRKENGIPEAPDAYDVKIAGHEWTDADQPTLEGFKAVAHANNLTQAQVNQLAAWKLEEDQRVAAEYERKLKQQEAQDREACDDALRAEFGISELKPNKAIMKRLLEDDEVFGEAGRKLISAYYFDEDTGIYRRVLSDKSIARGMIAMAMDRYGEGAMAGSDARVNTANEIEKLEKLMKDDYDSYIRSGGADKLLALRQEEEARAAKKRR
jgi:hypothetical protein